MPTLAVVDTRGPCGRVAACRERLHRCIRGDGADYAATAARTPTNASGVENLAVGV